MQRYYRFGLLPTGLLSVTEKRVFGGFWERGEEELLDQNGCKKPGSMHCCVRDSTERGCFEPRRREFVL